jgi:tetratricopeptide (TPR) repeat protein
MEDKLKVETSSATDSNLTKKTVDESVVKKTTEKKDKTFSLVFSGILLIIFLLPLVFAPAGFISLSAVKVSLSLGLFFVILFLWSILRLKDESFKVPLNYMTLVIILVPIAYLISTFFSANFHVSMFGRGFNFDSTLSIITLFSFLILGAFIFKDKIRSIYVYSIIVISSILTLLLNLVYIFFGSYLPDLGYFISSTTNTVGKWFDFGIFAGLGLIISIVFLELSKPKKRAKIAFYILFVLSFISLLVVGFMDLWIVVGIFSLGLFIYHLVTDKVLSNNIKSRLPMLPLIVFVVSALLLISGNGITGVIQRNLDINFNEIRPGFSTTVETVKQVLVNKTYFGYGPQRFNNAWIDYKDDSVNLTDVWNTDFNYGYSFILTSFATTGVVGLIAWLLFFGFLIWAGLNTLFKSSVDNTNRILLVTSFISSFYLWVMAIIYVPNITVIFLTFVMTSLFVASLYREEYLSIVEIEIAKKPKYGFVYIFLLVAVLIVSLSVVYKHGERLISERNAIEGIIAFNQNNLDLAEEKISTAIRYNPNDNLFINLSDIQQFRTSQIQNFNLSDSERTSLYQNFISLAISNAMSAIEYDPTSYSNYLYAGLIFSDLINIGVEGSSERAKEFIEKASELNPKNPAIYLELARIEMRSNDLEQAKKYINQAISLKPNYTDAVYLLSQINVEEGEIETAIENVRLTTLVRPNDPVTYFQLGLLQYQNEDFSSAVDSFENAVIKNRFYANAKYFLGLSYYQNDRVKDAVNQFADLNLMFPANQEIIFILNNLNNGLDPFYGANDSGLNIDNEPESGEKLPVEDSE